MAHLSSTVSRKQDVSCSLEYLVHLVVLFQKVVEPLESGPGWQTRGPAVNFEGYIITVGSDLTPYSLPGSQPYKSLYRAWEAPLCLSSYEGKKLLEMKKCSSFLSCFILIPLQWFKNSEQSIIYIKVQMSIGTKILEIQKQRMTIILSDTKLVSHW